MRDVWVLHLKYGMHMQAPSHINIIIDHWDISVWRICLTSTENLTGTHSPDKSWSRPREHEKLHSSPSENKTLSQTCPPAQGEITPEFSACFQYSDAHNLYLKENKIGCEILSICTCTCISLLEYTFQIHVHCIFLNLKCVLV